MPFSLFLSQLQRKCYVSFNLVKWKLMSTEIGQFFFGNGTDVRETKYAFLPNKVQKKLWSTINIQKYFRRRIRKQFDKGRLRAAIFKSAETVHASYIVVLFRWSYKICCVSWFKDGSSQLPLAIWLNPNYRMSKILYELTSLCTRSSRIEGENLYSAFSN